MLAMTIGVVSAAVLLFGSVHPWAYWPLLFIASGTAIRALLQGYKVREYRGHRAWFPGVLIVVPVVAQLLPVSVALLAGIAPANDRFLGLFDVAYALGGLSAHSLSIDPALTAHAILFL